MYSLVIRPISAKRAADLWRMNTQNDYVKGEELLTTWAPRKVSLVRDYIAARKRRYRIAELHAARGALSAGSLRASPARGSGRSTPMRGQDLNERKTKLLKKYLDLWSTKKDPTEAILVRTNTEPPSDGADLAAQRKQTNGTTTTSTTPSVSDKISLKPRFIATIQTLPKNPSALKTGYVLTPDDTNSVWVRRFVELRRPYLHIYSVPDGDEINAINLRNARVDHAPDFARLLDGSGAGNDRSSLATKGRPNIFAVYGTQNTFLFATRTEAHKVEWILKIDESYV
jgi:kinesin family protein 1